MDSWINNSKQTWNWMKIVANKDVTMNLKIYVWPSSTSLQCYNSLISSTVYRATSFKRRWNTERLSQKKQKGNVFGLKQFVKLFGTEGWNRNKTTDFVKSILQNIVSNFTKYCHKLLWRGLKGQRKTIEPKKILKRNKSSSIDILGDCTVCIAR